MTTSPQRVSYQTTDYDRAGEYLTEVYGTNMQMTGRRVGYAFRFTQLTTPTFSIGNAAQTDEMAIHVERPVSLYVVRPRGTTMEHLAHNGTHQVGPGELFIASTEDAAPYSVRWVDGAIEATALPFDLIRQVASTGGQVDEAPIRFSDLHPYNRGASRNLAATIDYVIEGLRDRPDSMGEPLVSSTVGQLLCATVLSTFPNTALVEPTIEDRHDSHPRTLRRAIAYIEGHAHEEITVADIAAAAHVTIRALQHAFRRHRDTTPMGYVRLVRLRQAHLELLSTDPVSGVTVTQVAARWGFFHPGRFARYYREVHGCSPYQTLLRDAP